MMLFKRPFAKLLIALLATLLLSGCGVPSTDSSDKAEWQLINYWAEWCKPCIEEIGELNEFAHLYQDKVQVMGVNFDGLQGEALAAAGSKLGIKFKLLQSDPHQQFGYPRPSVLPTTVIIGPDKQIKEVLLGPQTVDSLAKAIGMVGNE